MHTLVKKVFKEKLEFFLKTNKHIHKKKLVVLEEYSQLIPSKYPHVSYLELKHYCLNHNEPIVVVTNVDNEFNFKLKDINDLINFNLLNDKTVKFLFIVVTTEKISYFDTNAILMI